MNMGDSDKTFFTNLVTRFKKEILEYMERKFTDQEKLFNSRLAPLKETADRHTTDLKELYEANRKVVDRFFTVDNKIEKVNGNIREQGVRFGGRIDEIEHDIKDHKKGHDKTGSNIKWIIGIIFMLIFSGAGLIISILGGL